MKKLITLILVMLTAPSLLWAQELTMDKQKQMDGKLANGWHPKSKLGVDLSFSSSSSVVGQEDGDSMTIGGNLANELVYKKDQSEWRQNLNLNAKTAKSPSLPRFVKSADELKYESLYLYSLESNPRIGPYVRVSASAPMFIGESVQAEDKTFIVTNTGQNLGTGKSQRLTDGFKPLTTAESVGMFYKAIDRANTKLDFRVGLGAQQISAKDQLVLADDSDTPQIDLKELDDSSIAGLEYAFSWKGKWDDRSDYSFTGLFLTPFGEDIDDGKECDECDTIELTNVELDLTVSTKINTWASLKYQYKALKQPKTLNVFQISHGLVLAIEHNLL